MSSALLAARRQADLAAPGEHMLAPVSQGYVEEEAGANVRTRSGCAETVCWLIFVSLIETRVT